MKNLLRSAFEDLRRLIAEIQCIAFKSHYILLLVNGMLSNHIHSLQRGTAIAYEKLQILLIWFKVELKEKVLLRLIPVSAVGLEGFATLLPDGSMAINLNVSKPFQIEAPFACVLPDIIKHQLDKKIEENEGEAEANSY